MSLCLSLRVLCLGLVFVGSIATAWAEISVPRTMRDRDVIMIEGRLQYGYIVDEREDGILYSRTDGGRLEEPVRWRRVDAHEYKEMRGQSLWSVGQQAYKSGNYIEAAQRFEALAGGERKWQQAYGLIYAGLAWEAAGAYDRAAEAYGRFVANEAMQTHRWYLDALYYYGLALSRSQQTAAAVAVQKRLQTISEDSRTGPNSDSTRKNKAVARARAIEASLTIGAGNQHDAVRLARGIVWSAADTDLRFHWGRFWAGYLREQGAFNDAAREYERLLEAVSAPEQRAVLSLGLGICLVEGGKLEEAQFELLKLDALPYGSPEERLQASYYAGKAKWELSQKLLQSDNPKRKEFGAAEAIEARRMLRAAAASTVGGPFKDLAESYLSSLPPEPEADKSPAAAGES